MISSVLACVNILKSSTIFRRQPEWLGLLVVAATHMLMFCVVCRIAPNCVIKAKSVRTRVFVSDEIEDCKDLSGLYYLLAFQKVKYYQQHFIFGQYFHCFLCRYFICFWVVSLCYECVPFQYPGLFSWQGYLVNWDIERQVWDHLFGKERLAVSDLLCLILQFSYR